MQMPLQIEFRNVDHSPTLEKDIRRRAEKLGHLVDKITSCHVVIELPHKHKSHGEAYHVSMDIDVPGKEIVVSRNPGRIQDHVDPYVAVRDAFKAAERQLRSYARVRRKEIKAHDRPQRGRIIELNREQDFGRIESAGGREVYFHRNSVSGADLEELEIGFEVWFDEEPGEQGPQATYVKIIGAYHIAG